MASPAAPLVAAAPPVDAAVAVPEQPKSTDGFSPEKQALVNASWKEMRKDSGQVALKFFLNIFEIAPAAKGLFSFLKDSDVPLESNPQLKKHAVLVFQTTGSAATQLGQKGALDALRPLLAKLSRTHVAKGVIDAHFDVVKSALLKTIEEALPGPDAAPVTQAWAQAYDELATVFKAEMQAIRDSQTE